MECYLLFRFLTVFFKLCCRLVVHQGNNFYALHSVRVTNYQCNASLLLAVHLSAATVFLHESTVTRAAPWLFRTRVPPRRAPRAYTPGARPGVDVPAGRRANAAAHGSCASTTRGSTPAHARIRRTRISMETAQEAPRQLTGRERPEGGQDSVWSGRYFVPRPGPGWTVFEIPSAPGAFLAVGSGIHGRD